MSRFDLILGRTPPKKAEAPQNKETKRNIHKTSLKLTNERTGVEVRCMIGDFNLSIAHDGIQPIATISLTLHCSSTEAQNLFHDLR
jgi:hypothetical protein